MAVLFLSTSRKWCFLISTRLSIGCLIISCRINKLCYYDYVSDTVKERTTKII
nr:MAG TPA: hypothetical protein [Caudoviricetes sp.]